MNITDINCITLPRFSTSCSLDFLLLVPGVAPRQFVSEAVDIPDGLQDDVELRDVLLDTKTGQ